MAADPNWARWIFASVADCLKSIATENDVPVLVEHLDERTDAFMRAEDRVEVRITGPFTQELSKGYHRIWVDANVLITSRYGGKGKNAYDILKIAGLYHEAMTLPIPVWNYGNEPGDFVEADPESQVFIGCLLPRPGKNDTARVFNFGQTDRTDKLKQSAVDARFVMYLAE
jgi:hypothetical protein